MSPKLKLLKSRPCLGKMRLFSLKGSVSLADQSQVTNYFNYRESEAQTDPFTPEYVIEKENAPEVLTIAHLKYGKGLPASMAEMELIEQMREKRAFENALPPTSDEACFTLRRKLMEEQEFREWNKREEDIKRIQNERLNLL